MITWESVFQNTFHRRNDRVFKIWFIFNVIRSINHLFLNFFKVYLTISRNSIWKQSRVEVIFLKLHAEYFTLLVNFCKILKFLLVYFLQVWIESHVFFLQSFSLFIPDIFNELIIIISSIYGSITLYYTTLFNRLIIKSLLRLFSWLRLYMNSGFFIAQYWSHSFTRTNIVILMTIRRIISFHFLSFSLRISTILKNGRS